MRNLKTVVLALLIFTIHGLASAQNTANPKIKDIDPDNGSLGTVVCFTLDSDPPKDRTLDKMVLFVKGQELKEIQPYTVNAGEKKGCFVLSRTDQNASVWKQVLSIFGNADPDIRPGWQETGPLTPVAPEKKFRLTISGIRISVFLVVFVILLISFFVLAKVSNLLKNADLISSAPASGPYAYSLGRVQMAWWFFITMASILMIWLVTGDFTVTSQVLTLIGISGATGLGAIAIDAGKQSGAAQEAADVGSQLQTVDADATPAHKALADHLNAKITSLLANAKPPKANNNFLKDILSDKNGVSFHRFQIIGWTIVVGLYFVFQVFATWNLPNLSTTLLTLMGISSGTYLGFKFPEMKN